MKDQDFIEKLKRGDREAVEYLYSNAFHYCAKIVLSNNGAMSDAKDLFQEALMVLFKNLRKKDFQLTCDIKTYLYSVMRNLWLKRLNVKKRRGTEVEMQDYHQDFLVIDDDEISFKERDEERYGLMNKAFKVIKEDCRNLLMDYYFKKISLKEIAVQMDYTYQFIKVKKNRCMSKLRSEVLALQK